MFINKKISKFFVNVDQENELEDDFDTDELEAISEDEQIDDVSDLLYENNKKFSQQHASNIKQQMKVMGRLYHQMTGSLEQNFAPSPGPAYKTIYRSRESVATRIYAEL